MGSILQEPEADVNASSVKEIVKAIESGRLPRFENCINSIVTATVAKARKVGFILQVPPSQYFIF